MNDYVTYEQPIDELIRACLRLELLFKQLDHTLTDTSVWGSRFAIETLLEIMHVVDRPDIKNRFAKILSNYALSFSALDSNPHVDKTSLEHLLHEIDHLIDGLHADQHKIGKSLRDRPFLSQIKQHINSPGGLHQFNTPAYHLWLKHPLAQRIKDIENWRSELALLKETVDTILRITRSSKKTTQESAQSSHFQSSFEAGPPLYLIQVSIPKDAAFYPKISISKRYVSIYFYQLGNVEGEFEVHDSTQSLSFKLSCCFQQPYTS